MSVKVVAPTTPAAENELDHPEGDSFEVKDGHLFVTAGRNEGKRQVAVYAWRVEVRRGHEHEIVAYCNARGPVIPRGGSRAVLLS